MLRRSLPLLFGVLLLSACDDPSNVGLGLVGDEGGAPMLHRTPATPFDRVDDQREIGGGTFYALAGHVDDPLVGEMAATAYVDFGDPVRFGQGDLSRFRASTVREAYLQIPRRYLYGDTLSAVTYALRRLTSEFSQVGAPVDTTITPGALVTTFTYALPDSLVKIPLPTSWIAANDTTLRSSTFPASFNGFQIDATEGNAIIGFTTGTIRLFAVSAQDTVTFTANKSITTTRRLREPTLPDGYVLLQDGFRSARRIAFDFDSLAVSRQGLSRFALELHVDTTLVKQTPAHFVRPMLSTAELIGYDEDATIPIVRASGSTVCENAFACTLGRIGADERIVLSNATFTAIGRNLLLDKASTIQGAYVRPPLESGTMNVLLVRAPGTPEAPTFVFTVVPID